MKWFLAALILISPQVLADYLDGAWKGNPAYDAAVIEAEAQFPALKEKESAFYREVNSRLQEALKSNTPLLADPRCVFKVASEVRKSADEASRSRILAPASISGGGELNIVNGRSYAIICELLKADATLHCSAIIAANSEFKISAIADGSYYLVVQRVEDDLNLSKVQLLVESEKTYQFFTSTSADSTSVTTRYDAYSLSVVENITIRTLPDLKIREMRHPQYAERTAPAHSQPPPVQQQHFDPQWERLAELNRLAQLDARNSEQRHQQQQIDFKRKMERRQADYEDALAESEYRRREEAMILQDEIRAMRREQGAEMLYRQRYEDQLRFKRNVERNGGKYDFSIGR